MPQGFSFRQCRVLRIGSHLRDIIVEAVFHIAIECSYGAAVALEEHLVSFRPEARDILVAIKSTDFITVERQVSTQVPFQRTVFEDIIGECELQSLVGDISAVDQLLTETRRAGNCHVLQQVARLFIIIVDGQLQTVVHPSEVDTRIKLCRSLPLQVGVVRSSPVNHGHATLQRPVIRIVGSIENGQCTIGSNRLITRFTIADTELQVTEEVEVLNKLFLAGTPCECT